MAATHAGMTRRSSTKIIKDWIATARHPRFKRPYTELVYQPMLELLGYLRANGFKTFIVSGGGIEFMRPWVEKIYGIPPEQVIGSTGQDEVRDARRQADTVRSCRKSTSSTTDPASRSASTASSAAGRSPPSATPMAICEMLQWTTTGGGPRFGLIVHHTDAEREYAYDRQSHVGKLDKALDAAAANRWTVVDMKKDWKRIFAPNMRTTGRPILTSELARLSSQGWLERGANWELPT